MGELCWKWRLPPSRWKPPTWTVQRVMKMETCVVVFFPPPLMLKLKPMPTPTLMPMLRIPPF
jgi:hypothetical protein